MLNSSQTVLVNYFFCLSKHPERNIKCAYAALLIMRTVWLWQIAVFILGNERLHQGEFEWSLQQVNKVEVINFGDFGVLEQK